METTIGFRVQGLGFRVHGCKKHLGAVSPMFACKGQRQALGNKLLHKQQQIVSCNGVPHTDPQIQ